MTPIVYHNPRCSKSRATIKLLEEHNIAFDIRLYLQTPPSQQEIKQLLEKLNFQSARELMRTTEDVYGQLKLDQIDEEKLLIEAMNTHPKLIERPIVVTDNQAKIGRPPESVLELFS